MLDAYNEISETAVDGVAAYISFGIDRDWNDTGMILDGGMIMYPLAVGILMMWLSIGVVYLLRYKAKIRIYPSEQKYLLLMILPFWLISAVLSGYWPKSIGHQ